MISVQEVVVDPDMIAPHPYTVYRSTGKFVLGGFDSTVTAIPTFGPVQQASNKELQMLDEADRVGAVRSFWNPQPFYVTRGYAPVPGIHGEPLTGQGPTYTLSALPPAGTLNIYVNGLFMTPGIDYEVNGLIVTFFVPLDSAPYATWQVTARVAAAASDIIQYDSEKYRVLSVYFDPGGGYFKALATRMAAA